MMTCDIRINGRQIYLLEFINKELSIGDKTQYFVKSTRFDEPATEGELGTHMVTRYLWHNPKDGALKLLQEGIRKIGEKSNARPRRR